MIAIFEDLTSLPSPNLKGMLLVEYMVSAIAERLSRYSGNHFIRHTVLLVPDSGTAQHHVSDKDL